MVWPSNNVLLNSSLPAASRRSSNIFVVRRAVSETSSAVNYWVDALTSDDGGMINELQHSKRLVCLSTGRHESLKVLSDGQFVCNDHAEHLQAAAAHDAWQRSRLSSMPSSPTAPAVCKNYFAQLATVWLYKQVDQLSQRDLRCRVDQFWPKSADNVGLASTTVTVICLQSYRIRWNKAK